MSYMFPPTAGLEHAKTDPDEPIYPGSIGSNRIFHVLREGAGQSDAPRWDLWLINVYTLLRNAYSTGITQAAIEALIDTDVDLFMTFIGAHMSFRRPTPGVVLFYAPDYHAIPKVFLRDVSGQKQRQEIDVLYEHLLRKLPTKLTDLTEDPMLRKYLVATSRTVLPHRDLPGHIRAIYAANGMRFTRGAVLVSHCQVDLHLAKTIGPFDLLESYTGLVRPPTRFGQKLTKDVEIPFNTATHRAFGDDVHLAPLCKGKRKTELVELAKARNWAVRTETEIMADIAAKFDDITLADLIRLRL